MKRSSIAALVATGSLAAGAFTFASGPVGAAFPGKNGKIAFTRGMLNYPELAKGIGTVDPDGSNANTITAPGSGIFDQDPVWSPDGTKVLYNRRGFEATEAWVADADGSNNHKIADDVMSPTWSPDGTEIAYVSWCPSSSDHCLMRMRADGTNPQQVGPPSTDLIGRPTWSSDGAWIAFDAEGDIWKIRVDGTSLTNLTNTPDIREEFPDWSPDGAKIAYDHVDDNNGSVRTIWVMNPDGSGQTNIIGSNEHNYDSWPAWSPDGTMIAFNSNRNAGIWVMNADGSDQHAVTSGYPDGAEFHPSWQPIHPAEPTTTTTMASTTTTTAPGPRPTPATPRFAG